MEKIYQYDEEIDKKYDNKNKKRSSLLATLAVAIIAISGVVVLGFNKNSMAAPVEVGKKFPDSFETVKDEEGGPLTKLVNSSAMINGKEESTGIGILYATINGKQVPVFCTQRNVEVYGDVYKKGDKLNDRGLTNLILHIDNVIDGKIANVKEGNREIVRSWLKQAAIWVYLYDIGDKDNTKLGLQQEGATEGVTVKDIIVNSNKLYLIDGTDVYSLEGKTLFNEFGITDLITKSKAVKESNLPVLSIKKKSDKVSMTNDEKFYQSDAITVTSTLTSDIDSFNNFAIKILDGAPKGTIIVDKDGNEIKDLSALAPDSTFYVRVPVENITNDNKIVKINIDGLFKMHTAREYLADGFQTVISIDLDDEILTEPVEIEFNYTPPTENTRAGITPTLYLIGFIVLISGVAIIYANTKAESKM